jgi:DNA-binding IclR family transcriptional regulator
LTHRTKTNVDDLRRDLAETRERGYAIDDQESTKGLGCLAVALPLSPPPANAISCSVPTVRLGVAEQRRIVEHLLEARERIMARQRRHHPRNHATAAEVVHHAPGS